MAKILILAYHRIARPDPGAQIKGLYATPAIVRLHVRLLKLLGYEFMTVSQALDAKDSARKIACITMDDGYRDNLVNGYPVLGNLGIPATVYVVTGSAGARNHVWEESMDKVPFALLDWGEILELRRSGWEIGSHAHEHVHLTKHPVEQMRDLVRMSKDILEQRLGVPVRSFAYPYGELDHSVTGVVKETGFDSAVTTRSGINYGARLDPFRLSRVPMKGYHPRHYTKALKLLRWL